METKYIIAIIAAVAIAWRMNLLPAFMKNFLDAYVPPVVADFVRGPLAPTKTEQTAAACPPKGQCADFRTNTQCGLCPNGCEWIDEKCRSRGLTPEEKQQ